MDEICMVLLARACGNGDFDPHVAEKSVRAVEKKQYKVLTNESKNICVMQNNKRLSRAQEE